MSSWRPDDVINHDDGSRTEIKWLKIKKDASRPRIRKIISSNGYTREVWHEVIKGDKIIHSDRKYPTANEEAG